MTGVSHQTAAAPPDFRSPSIPQARLYIGEVKASARPLLLQTLLGSCVSVCLWDPVSGIGGMNHILLPGRSPEGFASRFGVHAMEALINEMMKLGGNRRRFVAKCFGGANVLACLQPPTVGDLNIRFVTSFLEVEAIPLVAQQFGGKRAMQVAFRTDTGDAVARPVGASSPRVVIKQEETYVQNRARELSCGGEVVLF